MCSIAGPQFGPGRGFGAVIAIRLGFGPVKAEAIAKADEKRRKVLEAFENDAENPHATAAE